ncbi:hypothetical protein BCR34DRAFT_598283 [Clohesyomyces aquaticus]|uniref:DUF6594 domain-containing protein n=1 Tax=Clohesyomyces aquaticus TaxID=1231657 RepID=A0A1Y1ZZ98_9PLEO|nr:hypothetical protein BCR34DRAFT_598283 [Clohesyomyces aquaticus]
MSEPQPMNGYTKLASLIGSHPELAIFRRFGALNAQNLLYLQAELVHLENRLGKCFKADAESGHIDRKLYDRDWQSLAESGFAPDGNPEQWATALQIRRVLREYNEALLVQTLLAKHDGPLKRDLIFLQNWKKRPSMGYVYLLGANQDIWENPVVEDLIAVKRHEGHSLATRVIGDFLVYWWRRFSGKKSRQPRDEKYANTIHYSNSSLAKASALLGAVCASTLPVLAIVVLSCVHSMTRRLAIIVVFTPIFSLVLGIFTNGRGIEIFAATAA